MRPKSSLTLIILLYMALPLDNAAVANDLLNRVEHGYINNKGVKIHYVSLGQGPLMVMLHGYPDYWYTWRHQMHVLSEDFKVVAIDLRGYNKSDKPAGVENYAMRHLISDVTAVIGHFGGKATVVGHDWGGAIAWQVATWAPQMVDRLIVLSTPHPRGLFRELRKNPEQQRNSQYARDFQKEDAHKSLTAESLASWVTDSAAREMYVAAFERSDFEAMLNYYKASFPRRTSNAATSPSTSTGQAQQLKKIKCPTLVIHGLEDKALLPAGFNSTWEVMESDLTTVSIPNAGHFIQHEATDLVTRSILMWLNR